MRKCRKCNGDILDAKRVCNKCMQEWLDNRQKNYAIVVSEMGEHSHSNSTQFIKRLRQLEKQNTRN